MSDIPFRAGTLPPIPGPLARYLPPVLRGTISEWLEQNVPQGSWILDPFGASPRLIVEAARVGYRVLVASNNPIDRFLIDLAANPPDIAELRSSLADLGSMQKGDQRLEPHLQSLYSTICPNCQQETSVEAFIWERGAASPSMRIIHCQNCGDEGEFPITPADEAKLAQLPGVVLSRSRALERVTSLDDPDRTYVEEALDIYLPRTIYGLFTLVNKLESLPVHRRRPIYALLLAAFDQTSTLWPYPAQRSRPRQLSVPSRFRENNIWTALEGAINAWPSAYPPTDSRLPLVSWPQLLPDSGGIAIFDGRLRDLVDSWSAQFQSEKADPSIKIEAVITAIPRPNQAYWTLSALWSGWLWGREETARYKMVLHRRRYDWNWHFSALRAAFNMLDAILPESARMFGIIGEAETGFISAALLAGALAKLQLQGVALRQEDEQAQIEWEVVGSGNNVEKGIPSGVDSRSINEAATSDAKEFLCHQGEPVSYLQLHTAALKSITGPDSELAKPVEDNNDQVLTPGEFFSQIQNNLQQVFSYINGFTRFHGSSNSLDVGQWWLRESSKTTKQKQLIVDDGQEILPPLADRVEIEIVRQLVKQNQVNETDLQKKIYETFRGLHTPDRELILACLESYAEPDETIPIVWRLRPGEKPQSRREDLVTITNLLQTLGARLGFQVNQPEKNRRCWLWSDSEGNVQFVFFTIASAVIGEIVAKSDYPPIKCLFIYPGGRAGLLQFKLQHDSRLQSIIDAGWRFIKFRHLRRLVDSDMLDLQNLNEQLALDPMANQDPQISFI